MQIEPAFVSAMQRLANAFGQVDVGSRDDHGVGVLFDAHNAMERMLGTFNPFVVPGQMKNFQPVRCDKIPAHRDKARWIIVPDSLASLTGLRMRICRPKLQPLPAPAFENGVTNRTDAGFHGFAGCPVRIVNLLVQKTVFADTGKERSHSTAISRRSRAGMHTCEFTVNHPSHKLPLILKTP